MTRFSEYLAGSDATEEKLAGFLKANSEWVRLEFKEAKQVPTHGLRISIAALASTSGGDLFLGVKDDGTLLGCSFDPSSLSSALRQAGAPTRLDVKTNLVEVAGDPTTIPLANGNYVYWFDVPEYGWVVAALNDDGSLGLYDRPGANKEQVCGLAAVDFFNKLNRGRLLRRVYEEASALESGFSFAYQGPGKISDDTVDPLRRLVSGDEWDQFARKEERAWIRDDQYLALFLRLPRLHVAWDGMFGKGIAAYQRQQSEMIETKNALTSAVNNIRNYLRAERILPPS